MGAFLGPLLAVGLMLCWANDCRALFWLALIPGLLAVAWLLFGMRAVLTLARFSEAFLVLCPQQSARGQTPPAPGGRHRSGLT